MQEDQYISELIEVLQAQSEKASTCMKRVLERVPEKAQMLNFEIFPDQDGEGAFSVHANVDGPDLFVLNKQIESVASIFDVVHTPTGFEPSVPMLDPFETEFDYENVVVDCVAHWVKQLWGDQDNRNIFIPVAIVGHEGAGNATPIYLQ